MPSVIPTHDATTETAFAWRDGWVMAKRALLKIKDVSISPFCVYRPRRNQCPKTAVENRFR